MLTEHEPALGLGGILCSLEVWTIIYIDNGTENSDIKDIPLQEKADRITNLAFVQEMNDPAVKSVMNHGSKLFQPVRYNLLHCGAAVNLKCHINKTPDATSATDCLLCLFSFPLQRRGDVESIIYAPPPAHPMPMNNTINIV